MAYSPFRTTPSGVEPWILDKGEATESRIDIVDAEAGMRHLGESYDYTITLADRPGQDRPSTVQQRYDELLERSRYQNEFNLHEMASARPEYTPKWPDSAESLVVSLEPTRPRQSTVPGFWGLLEEVAIEEPPTVPPGGRGPNAAQLTLSMVYMASIDRFDDREEFDDRLAHPGL